MVAAALVLAALAILGGEDETAGVAIGPSAAALTPEPTPASPRVAAHVTTNLRLSPHRAADVAAVIPGGREAELLGRSADGNGANGTTDV